MNQKEQPGAAGRILIVDDDVDICDVMAIHLEDVGYTTCIASDGPEALRLLERATFDAAVVDLVLPGMDGLELLRKAKKQDPELGIIMVTGHATIETAVAAMREGAYDYIAKPFHPEALQATVGRAVERRFLKREAEQKETYRRLSITDGLTDLYNHRYFHEAFEVEMARSRRNNAPVSLLILDVDDFKLYNDTNGHLAGDRALQEIARLLTMAVRKIDIVARYGGEEFAVILPDTDRKGAWAVALKILELFRMADIPFDPEQVDSRLTASIGAATGPQDADSGEGLLQAADQALYQAKRLGKNRACDASNLHLVGDHDSG